MVKMLSAVGDGFGVVIDRPMLELLGISEHTPLEVKTDGEVLIIRPLKQRAPLLERALASADSLMDAHEETFRKLAQ